MDRRWIALAAALVLTGTLTACGGNDNRPQPQPNDPVTNSGMENEVTGDQNTPNQNNMENDRAGMDVRGARSRKSQDTGLKRRTAYDYLRDGNYAADPNGRVKPGRGAGESLTQGAKDLIREGTDAVRRAGQDVENVTRDMLQ